MKHLGHETRGLARAEQALALAQDALEAAQRELTLATPLEPEYSQDFRATFDLLTKAHAATSTAKQQISSRQSGPSGELMLILSRNAGLAGTLEMVAAKLGMDMPNGIPDEPDEFSSFAVRIIRRAEDFSSNPVDE